MIGLRDCKNFVKIFYIFLEWSFSVLDYAYQIYISIEKALSDIVMIFIFSFLLF